MNEVKTDALNVSPASAAIELVTQPERCEEEISAAYQAILAGQLGIDLESVSHSEDQGGA